MRKVLLTFLILATIIPCLACPSLAGAKYSGGTGDPNDPYQIANVADLMTLANDANDYNKCFIMTADIDLDPNILGNQVFTQAVIAPDINDNYDYQGTKFKGVFDGNGHNILNFNIQSSGEQKRYIGFFGVLDDSGIIRNLGVVNAVITAPEANCVSTLCCGNDGLIANCHTISSIVGGTAVGGICGYSGYGSSIKDCCSIGDINGFTYVGGLVGDNWDGTITNCYAKGTITGYGALGVLCGNNNSGTIVDCCAEGAVIGTIDTGGLCGYIVGGSVTKCSAACLVIGKSYFGGLAGTNSAGRIGNCYSTGSVTGSGGSRYVGGLVGYNGSGDINNSYSTGIVTGDSNVGGFAGYNQTASRISSCYFLDVAGPNNGYGKPLTDAQMKQKDSFYRWDFKRIWDINEGVDYPKLSFSWTTKYSGGTGEPNDPYQIADFTDLVALGVNISDYNKCFILTDDIDLDPNLPGNQVFTQPVIAVDINYRNQYFDGIPFTGVFDGNGHKIINLTIDTRGGRLAPMYLGLFGCISTGEVKNLVLENAAVTAAIGGSNSQIIGGLAGQNISGTISDCFVRSNIIGGSYIGAVFGENDGGSVSGCSASGTVSGGTLSTCVGGFAGLNYGSISDCHYAGNVTSGGSSYDIGGFAGADGNNGIAHTIKDCSSAGSVLVGYESFSIGGLVGANYCTISGCFSTADVNAGPGSRGTGGLVGGNGPGDINNCYAAGRVYGNHSVGGLVGTNGSATHYVEAPIRNSYSTGKVSGADIGGLVGADYSHGANNCYYLDTAGPNNNVGTPLTDAQMKQQASFVGWDFNDVWHICETTNYPKLTWQILPGDIVCPDGVDISDLAELCSQWLLDEIPADIAPLPNGDHRVDLTDFALMANNWLQGF
jgi:hypothetical protein